MTLRGWYQVAFERELSDVTPVAVGERQLVIARTEHDVHAYDAACPHRGAHLGMGGRLDGGAIVCPFHGYRIGLARGGDHDFSVRRHATLLAGGLVFVCVDGAGDEDLDRGFARFVRTLDDEQYIVPGFTLTVDAPAALVIENAFDNSHFRTVHKIGNEPRFEVAREPSGSLGVSGAFRIPHSKWQRGVPEGGMTDVPYVGRAFSPHVVVSTLGGEFPYSVITTATPRAPDRCVIRLSLAVRPGPGGEPPETALCQYLLQQSKAGLEQDRIVWEHLIGGSAEHLTAQDRGVLAFRAFCREFESGS